MSLHCSVSAAGIGLQTRTPSSSVMTSSTAFLSLVVVSTNFVRRLRMKKGSRHRSVVYFNGIVTVPSLRGARVLLEKWLSSPFFLSVWWCECLFCSSICLLSPLHTHTHTHTLTHTHASLEQGKDSHHHHHLHIRIISNSNRQHALPFARPVRCVPPMRLAARNSSRPDVLTTEPNCRAVIKI